jgi:hypothetical protein
MPSARAARGNKNALCRCRYRRRRRRRRLALRSSKTRVPGKDVERRRRRNRTYQPRGRRSAGFRGATQRVLTTHTRAGMAEIRPSNVGAATGNRAVGSARATPAASRAEPYGQIGAKVWGSVWGVPRCARVGCEGIIGVMTIPADRAADSLVS